MSSNRPRSASVDLLSEQRSWSVDLPAGTRQDYLRPPVVLGDTVVVAAGREERTETDGRVGNYVVDLVGNATSAHVWAPASG